MTRFFTGMEGELQDLRRRMDELAITASQRCNGCEALELRVAALERRLDEKVRRKTPLQRDDLLNGSRTGERSTQHGTRSQNARSPEAPATLPEHRVLVVHPALTRWLAQLTARAGVIVFFSTSYDKRINTVCTVTSKENTYWHNKIRPAKRMKSTWAK